METRATEAVSCDEDDDGDDEEGVVEEDVKERKR